MKYIFFTFCFVLLFVLFITGKVKSNNLLFLSNLDINSKLFVIIYINIINILFFCLIWNWSFLLFFITFKSK